MAQTPAPPSFLLLLLINLFVFICFPQIQSSVPHPPLLPNQQHFQVLDASASIHKTFQVFRKTAPQRKEAAHHFTTTNSGVNDDINTKHYSSVLSLSLNPRTSIVKPLHRNYSALTLSRLAFDSARVNSISSKLQLALSRSSVPKPLPKHLPVTSGISQGTPEYLARVGVGRPVRDYFMVIDTGSSVNWLQCKPCDYCYRQSDPIFDPSGSSTYNPLSCSSRQCNSLRMNGCDGDTDTCRFFISYGDGSYSDGDFVTETVTFTGSDSVDEIAIGCGHDNGGLFYGSAGIIGLGGGTLSLPSQIKATSFSYCLVDMDSHSSSTLEFNSAPPSDSIFVPIVPNPRYNEYVYVDLAGISVGGESIPISPSTFQIGRDGSGGVIVDSGTVVTRLVTPAYNYLRDTFVKYTQHLPSTSGYSLFDTCYDLSGVPRNVQVPTVTFHFSGGKQLSLKAKNCLIPVDSYGTFCFAFAPSDSISIIGSIQQQETRVNYDLVDKRIGFSLSKC